jgi:SAM-dependent methyltransferase
MVEWLEAAHGGRPRVLREDFSGAGAICRAWVGSARGRRAIAVDRDPEPLARLRGARGVRAVRADVMACGAKADVIAAVNFPLGYFFERPNLVAYLRACRGRLNPGGVLVADVYGGRSAFDLGTFPARFVLADGTPVAYEWEHRAADALTARVTDVIHFRVGRGRRAVSMRDAFVYEWRLWSIPELRDACAEAGLGEFCVYDRGSAARDHAGRLHLAPVEHGSRLEESWVAYVAVRRGGRG